jgi:hypothetical protein
MFMKIHREAKSCASANINRKRSSGSSSAYLANYVNSGGRHFRPFEVNRPIWETRLPHIDNSIHPIEGNYYIQKLARQKMHNGQCLPEKAKISDERENYLIQRKLQNLADFPAGISFNNFNGRYSKLAYYAHIYNDLIQPTDNSLSQLLGQLEILLKILDIIRVKKPSCIKSSIVGLFSEIGLGYGRESIEYRYLDALDRDARNESLYVIGQIRQHVIGFLNIASSIHHIVPHRLRNYLIAHKIIKKLTNMVVSYPFLGIIVEELDGIKLLAKYTIASIHPLILLAQELD